MHRFLASPRARLSHERTSRERISQRPAATGPGPTCIACPDRARPDGLSPRRPRWAVLPRGMALLGGLLLVALSVLPVQTVQAAPSVALSSVAPPPVALRRLIPEESLRRPVHLAELPDGQGELVVVEQAGVIKRFRPEASRATGVFLDHRAKVSDRGNEEGLLSIAFHPRFAQNRFFYIYYAAAEPRRTVLARLSYDPARRAAAPASERVLLEVAQPYSNHKGGQLAFGPDGLLYVGLGDGGSGGDPHGNGQNATVLLGKILRLDVDAAEPYGIPPDNPFAAARDGRRGEIYALGLRNPWRFSFDRETGLLYAGDVGQDEVEEVDLIVRGGNYGWNVLEGTHCFRPFVGCSRAGMVPPIAEYTHAEGISITGGFVYRGRALPALRGRYVFGDYGAGTVWTIAAGEGAGLREKTVLVQSRLALSSFGEDRQGELYLLDLSGGVYRLVPAS
jgi:glucose/arabinose dehydrogenase